MRISFGGHGDPISTDPFAALAEAADDTLAFLLSDGDVWDPAPFIADGLTQFQAIVIGASGGFGGGFGTSVSWASTVVPTVATSDVWDDLIFLVTKYYARLEESSPPHYWESPAGSGHYPRLGWTGNSSPTIAQYLQHRNPTHTLNVRHWGVGTLQPNKKYSSGAPGGGGLQIVTGDLADLPEAGVEIVVGSAGTDAPLGQTSVHGLWTPSPGLADDAVAEWAAFGWPDSSYPLALAAANRIREWGTVLPDPLPEFANPIAGDDGGYSAFGDVAKASGGKGGAPAKSWGTSSFVVVGSGGDGGVGDSDVAGGGGAGGGGSATAPIAGADGHYADGIGEGGGGGHTGEDATFSGSPGGSGGVWFGGTDGSDGGLGSVEAGANKYGAKGVKSTDGAHKYVKPGPGGGARALEIGYGSRVSSYIPDGMVIVRVS